jgi:hypothetical protein
MGTALRKSNNEAGHVRLSQEKDRLATGIEENKKAEVKDPFKWGILTFSAACNFHFQWCNFMWE